MEILNITYFLIMDNIRVQRAETSCKQSTLASFLMEPTSSARVLLSPVLNKQSGILSRFSPSEEVKYIHEASFFHRRDGIGSGARGAG